jgi:hypothetical protein
MKKLEERVLGKRRISEQREDSSNKTWRRRGGGRRN